MSNFVLAFLANVFFSAPSIFLVVVSSHFGSFDEVALLGASFAICAPVQLFFSMQHNVSILAGRLSISDSLRTRVVLVIPFLLCGVLGSLYFSSLIIFWFFLYRCAEFLYEPFLCDRIRKGAYRMACMQSFLRFLVFSSIVLVLFYQGVGLGNVLLALGAVFSLLALKSIYVAFTEGAFSSDGLYLGVAAFLSSFIVNIPRYYVTEADPSFAAFYSSMLTLVLGGGLLYGAFNNYAFPKFSVSGKSGAFKFLNVSMGVFVVGLLLSFLLFSSDVISSLFLQLFLGEKYLQYSGLVIGFAVFYFVLYFHAALNFLFVYFGLGRLYMGSLMVYGISMIAYVYIRLNVLLDDFSSLIWIVAGFGVSYALISYVFLMSKFVRGCEK
ncbi:hypothetical protein [Pseudomonas sp. Pse1]|jgi:hypothetical protein|uniref:hypothetical protein n=1 Tax=Pseudomonas sp. Pse1 TaxID=2926020 RepID=UPI00211795BB|nr:hypothetical protein [Pseudomonas sp. Pse1]